MCVVIDSKVIISNTFYAYYEKGNANRVLTYDKIDEFRSILYEEISRDRRYVLFLDEESNSFSFFEHVFVKEDEGILCVNEINSSFIDQVNSSYSPDIQKIIAESRKKVGLKSL